MWLLALATKKFPLLVCWFQSQIEFRPEFETTDVLKKDDKGILFLDKTSFYSESGGQVGDTGEIVTESGSIFVVRGNPVKDEDQCFSTGVPPNLKISYLSM